MKRRLFTLLVAVSCILFVALILDHTFHLPAAAPPASPPPPSMTVTTDHNGVVTFNYHEYSTSVIRSYHVFGFRFSFFRAVILTLILPFCWALLRIFERLKTRPAPGHPSA